MITFQLNFAKRLLFETKWGARVLPGLFHATTIHMHMEHGGYLDQSLGLVGAFLLEEVKLYTNYRQNVTFV